MAVDTRALQTQMRADPRIKALIAGKGMGRILGADLQKLGYDVPEGYSYTFGGRAGYGTLMDDKRGIIEKAAPIIAIAAAAAAGGMALAPATAAGSAAPAAAGIGASVAAPSLAGTLLKYGLQYGLPVAANLIGTKMQTNAQSESDRAMTDYYNKALDAAKEEQQYRRTFDEEGRTYGRYMDQYGVASGEEDRSYGRAGDTYGRLSDEEKLAYGRAQAIRDKNYGYQQYGNFVETLEPYRAGGSAAASRMSQLVGGPATQDTGSYLNLAKTARDSVQRVPDVPNRPTWDYKGTRPTWNYPSTGNAGSQPSPSGGSAPPVSTTMPVGGGTQLVRVQAPDGEIREMSQAMAQSAVRLGARIV